MPVAQEGFGLGMAALKAAEAGNFGLGGVPLVGLLGSVGVAGGAAAGFNLRNVDVFGGIEHHGVVGDFVEVESGGLAAAQPGVEDQVGEGAVVAVLIQGPLGKDDIGVLGVEEAAKFIVVGVVDDGTAVVLVGENGARFQDFAGFLSFGGADRATLARLGSATVAFATIEIKQNDIVAEIGVAGDGAGAAAFGIAGMTAGHHDFEFAGRFGLGG